MENYNFDEVISRRGTYSAKWESASPTVIPLSVADMDIAAPDFIIHALAQANQKGIYGYTLLADDWGAVVADWLQRHYAWEVNPQHIVFCPRVVQAVSLYIQNFTRPDDKIVTLTPAYNPICQAVQSNNRMLLQSALIYHQGCYQIDFDDLENKFKSARCFILLSPHNPTGTVWTRRDLIKIAALAEKYGVFIISDDVHADFIFAEGQHQVISSISRYVQQNSFICTSPAKTFNLAGLEVANIVIANDEHRKKFSAALFAAGIHNPGYFAVPAQIAAYRHGDCWLAALKNYLAANRAWVKSFCQRHFPEWHICKGEGTYLLWIDYRQMGISEESLRHWFSTLAGVEMSWGSGFGDEGRGFFRVNIAAPRSLLAEAFERLLRTSPYTSGAKSDE